MSEMMTRDEIKKRLKALNAPWLSAAFAARIVTHILPLLAGGVKEGKPFLWFWEEERRQEYLLKVLRAWQCAWSASRFKNTKIANAAYADAYAADASAGAAAYAAAYAASAAYAAAGGAAYAYAYASAAAAYAAYADAYADAAKKMVDYILFFEKNKDVILFLERPFDNDLKSNYKTLLKQIQKWESSDFDFWADWIEARLQGEPLEEKTAMESCLLSEEILSQSPSQINAYLKSLQNKVAGTPLNRVRAIFIGFGAAGKTSLIRVLHGEPVVEGKEKMTPGIEIRDWPVPSFDNNSPQQTNGHKSLFSFLKRCKTNFSHPQIDTEKNLTAHLWDFGGQVMAHATHQFFLRSRCLYVLVLDGRTEINANEQAEYWLEHIRAFGANSPVLLVGNKADQVQINLDMRYLCEKYPNIVDFYPISCTRCEDEYKAHFERFRDDFIKQLQEVGMHQILFTKPHFSVLESVRELSPKQTFLQKNKFAELCRENGIKEKGDLDQKWLLDLLDKLGVIIHFPNLPWLNCYLLNPRWLTYGVYTLLYAERSQRQQGRLTPQAVMDILSDKVVTDNTGNSLSYKPENCRFILDALKQFEIGFQLDKDDSLLIPALLPSDTPAHGFNKQDALAFDFSFSGFLPRHLMPGFIVRRNGEIADHIVWQNGVKLRSQNLNAEALAQADYHERRLSLWVKGDQASRYFSALHDEIMQMLARMPDLKYKEWVRLPGGDKDQRAGFRHLLALEAAGEQRYICEYGTFSLSEVLKIMPPDERQAKTINIGKIDNYIGEKNMGDNIHIHDINNSVLNVKAHLDNAQQLVKTLPQAAPEDQSKLEDLLTQLSTQLQNVPQEKTEDAEAVAQMTENLLQEAKKEKPNKTMMTISGKGLIEAAGALSKVIPEVLPVANQIAETINGIM